MKPLLVKTETKVFPKIVWETWKNTHYWDTHKGNENFRVGQKGKAVSRKGRKARFIIADIKEGKSFTLIWKAFLVRLVFNHEVLPKERGSVITYRVRFSGLFAYPVKWLLSNKLKRDLTRALKVFVNRLES